MHDGYYLPVIKGDCFLECQEEPQILQDNEYHQVPEKQIDHEMDLNRNKDITQRDIL